MTVGLDHLPSLAVLLLIKVLELPFHLLLLLLSSLVPPSNLSHIGAEPLLSLAELVVDQIQLTLHSLSIVVLPIFNVIETDSHPQLPKATCAADSMPEGVVSFGIEEHHQV